MTRIAGYVAGAVVWCMAIFAFTLWLTFPSDTLVERIRYEVPRQLGPEYSAELASVSPWWFGVSAKDLKLYNAPTRDWRSEDAPVPTLVGLARDFRLRASPFSLLRNKPFVSGSVTLTDSPISYAVGMVVNERGGIDVTSAEIEADRISAADLTMLMPGSVSATGALDIDLDVEAGEDGLASAEGRAKVSGKSIVLSDIEIPGVGPLGMDIPIDDLQLSCPVREGKCEVDRGILTSPLLTVKIEGNVSLRDPISRSTLDIVLQVSDLGDDLKAFEGFLSSAKQSDGSYHFNCRGMVSRLRSCQPVRARTTSRRTNPSPRPSGSRVGTPRAGGEPRASTGDVDEERERRRQEIRERLRQRREDREREREEGAEDDEQDIVDEEMEEILDEDFVDDEDPDEEFEEFIDE